MTKLSSAMFAVLLGVTAPVQAHQIWLEQPDGGNATIRFGEFGDNLRETSPGLLDKFVKPQGTLVSTGGEQKADATKRSEEHTSELQSLMRISYAVFCLKKKITTVMQSIRVKSTILR